MNKVEMTDADFDQYLTETEGGQKVRSTEVFIQDILDHLECPPSKQGDTLPFPKTHSVLRFREGEVSLWTGFNGHGKSLLLGQTALSFAMSGKKVCIASMEMTPKTTILRMIRQKLGTDTPSPDNVKGFCHRVKDSLWFYDHQGTVKANRLCAVLKYCANELGIEHFIIDSLMKCGFGEDDYNGQKGFVDELTAIARDTGMHIHLVAHSKKSEDESRIPSKMDVRGSGTIIDQVDNILTIWRNKVPREHRKPELPCDAIINCDKQRNGDWEGRIQLWFDPKSTAYKEEVF